MVVEAEVCGYGASGRNAGIVGESLDHSHQLAVAHFGLTEARRLRAIGVANLAGLAADCADFAAAGHDTALERNGQLVVALSAEQAATLPRAHATAREVGAHDWQLLDRAATRARLDSPLYHGALLVPGNATVDPQRLVMALRAAALARGVAVFESSPVAALDFERSRGSHLSAVVTTAAGAQLKARRVVLATNAYSHFLWPRLAHRYLPLYDYVLTSAPLSPADRTKIGWAQREGVTDTRGFFNYYRLTADDRIVWGSSEAVYHRGGQVGPNCDHAPAVYQALEDSFRSHFPQLAGLDFPYRWGGPIAATTRFTPFFGTARGGALVYGLGYTGHGVGSTRLAGRILAQLAARDLVERDVLASRTNPSDGELLNLRMVRRQPLPYPPEPLRGWAIGAVTRALRRVDAGRPSGLLLNTLDRFGIGFSS